MFNSNNPNGPGATDTSDGNGGLNAAAFTFGPSGSVNTRGRLTAVSRTFEDFDGVDAGLFAISPKPFFEMMLKLKKETM